jgi:hydroxyethylthiazole kinase
MSATISHDAIGGCLERLRERRPLVHNITNFVVMNFTANVLLALGASPAMVHAKEEVEEFVGISSALVVNIGTLDGPWVANMELAARHAAAKGIPWTLDPVGAGATAFRTRTALALLSLHPSVLRANASEVIALSGASGHAPKGVDTTASSADAVDAGRQLSRNSATVVAVTGATDYVIGPDRSIAIAGGSSMTKLVTGTGCAVTACVGAFLAVEKDPVLAATAALAVFKAASAMAAESAKGPGTFQIALLDALHRLAPRDLAKHADIKTA